MKKIFLTLFTLMLSFVAMAQEEQGTPVLNINAVGLSLPVDDEDCIIEIKDMKATFRDVLTENAPKGMLDDLSVIKIHNRGYTVTASIGVATRENIDLTKSSFVSHLMRHMNTDIPGSRSIQHTIFPDYTTLKDLNYSVLQYSGYYKAEDVGSEELFMNYAFLYIRPLDYVVVLEMFCEPQYKDRILSYASKCINLEKDFVTGRYLSKEELDKADDGVNFLQEIAQTMQSQTNEEPFIEYINKSVGMAYCQYREFFGHNAPSYNGQDAALSNEDKDQVAQSIRNIIKENLARLAEEQKEQSQSDDKKPVKTIKKAGLKF
ncbi:MAG: hypothetical protein KBT33_07350 [Prevotellaceae bacterium]|nr:hypothetical protein [Candidatus Minthosoma equi]